eukprot:2525912-Heterocapsa_arctica.AAC.1
MPPEHALQDGREGNLDGDHAAITANHLLHHLAGVPRSLLQDLDQVHAELLEVLRRVAAILPFRASQHRLRYHVGDRGKPP